jgi:UDP-N-acetylglucosamine 2-epimerase (non-hydrolysing)
VDRIRKKRIAIVVGTRPEIVKLAPLARLMAEEAQLLHTGQHGDQELAGVFLAAARLPAPRTLDGICAAPRHAQVGRMIEQLGDIFRAESPAAVIVQGDTNSASAGAQAASYAGVPVVHVEAGLRSFDRAMPEEINRCLVGVLAELHCAPTRRAVTNLLLESVPAEKIEMTGNTIVEAITWMLPREDEARELAVAYGVEPREFVLATIHRPENTDEPGRLEAILLELGKLGLPVLMPLHPRTRLAAARHGLGPALDRLQLAPPVDHRTFLGLSRMARLIVSDSGGIQEECTVLKKPLIVVRNTTERQESIDAGFAHLVQPGPQLGDLGRDLIADTWLERRLAAVPSPFGDGKASERIAGSVRRFLS